MNYENNNKIIMYKYRVFEDGVAEYPVKKNKESSLGVHYYHYYHFRQIHDFNITGENAFSDKKGMIRTLEWVKNNHPELLL